MAKMIKRNKAVSVRPLKSGQPTGAVLAFQGLKDSIPMLHGSQGCSAFTKVFFVRHFKEPIPLQTTAMDQISTVMGGDENIFKGLETLSKTKKAQVIGLITTGLTEVQGADIHRVVDQFRSQHPELDKQIVVVPVNAADFTGCLESGFAKAVHAIIEHLVLKIDAEFMEWKSSPFINLLPGAHLTPGDLDVLKEYVTAFDLDPLVLPDLSSALDGHLPLERSSPVSVGGTLWEELSSTSLARATLSFGRAIQDSAQYLQERRAIPSHHLDGMMGLRATDRLIALLKKLSGNDVPQWIKRDRSRLLDAMMDTHFSLTNARVALAGDPDWLLQWKSFLGDVGIKTPVVVASTGTKELANSDFETVKIGDLEDMEEWIKRLDDKDKPHALIGNSHVAEVAGRLGLPAIRSGYPLYDWTGGHARRWIGYEGARQTLFELSNAIVHAGDHKLSPYRSRFAAA
ncbi:MAG: nitrogenase iron-molybdenum cofactor biosynthesis protein NifN [Magnetococcales bacterium]|nr:nitrogenase iron-molybdenum cofactor biosynthesis protein NifN [Magnetococcales bacterium]